MRPVSWRVFGALCLLPAIALLLHSGDGSAFWGRRAARPAPPKAPAVKYQQMPGAVHCPPKKGGGYDCISSGPGCMTNAVAGQCSFQAGQARELCAKHPECNAVTCNPSTGWCQARRSTKAVPFRNFHSYVRSVPRPILVNVAKGKLAEQSSTYPHPLQPTAEKAVDGNTDGDFNKRSTIHTNQEHQPWWQVDLGEAHEIAEIHVWNLSDGHKGRLNNFYVLVSEKPFGRSPFHVVQGQSWKHRHPTIGEAPTRIQVGKKGRYVRVQLVGHGYLQLAEVQVMVAKEPEVEDDGRLADGMRVSPPGQKGVVYLLLDGKKRQINADVYDTLFRGRSGIVVDKRIATVPDGPPIQRGYLNSRQPQGTATCRSSGGVLWYESRTAPLVRIGRSMSGGGRYWISRALPGPAFDAMNLKWPKDACPGAQAGPPLLPPRSLVVARFARKARAVSAFLPDGTRVKAPDNANVYLILDSKKRHIVDATTYNALFTTWEGIVTDKRVEQVPSGPPIQYLNLGSLTWSRSFSMGRMGSRTQTYDNKDKVGVGLCATGASGAWGRRGTPGVSWWEAGQVRPIPSVVLEVVPFKQHGLSACPRNPAGPLLVSTSSPLIKRFQQSLQIAQEAGTVAQGLWPKVPKHLATSPYGGQKDFLTSLVGAARKLTPTLLEKAGTKDLTPQTLPKVRTLLRNQLMEMLGHYQTRLTTVTTVLRVLPPLRQTLWDRMPAVAKTDRGGYDAGFKDTEAKIVAALKKAYPLGATTPSERKAALKLAFDEAEAFASAFAQRHLHAQAQKQESAKRGSTDNCMRRKCFPKPNTCGFRGCCKQVWFAKPCFCDWKCDQTCMDLPDLGCKASQAFKAAQQWIGNLWEGVKKNVGQAVNNLKQGAAQVWSNVQKGATQLWNNVKTGATQLWNNVKTGATQLWNNVQMVAAQVKKKIDEGTAKVRQAFNVIGQAVGRAWEGLKQKATQAWEAVKKAGQAVWEKVKEGSKWLGEKLKDAHQWVAERWEEIKNCHKDPLKCAKDAWEKFKENILKPLLDFLLMPIKAAEAAMKKLLNSVLEMAQTFFREKVLAPAARWALDQIFGGGTTAKIAAFVDRLLGNPQWAKDRIESVRDAMQAIAEGNLQKLDAARARYDRQLNLLKALRGTGVISAVVDYAKERLIVFIRAKAGDLFDKALDIIQTPIDAGKAAICGAISSIPFIGGVVSSIVDVLITLGIKQLRKMASDFVVGKIIDLVKPFLDGLGNLLKGAGAKLEGWLQPVVQPVVMILRTAIGGADKRLGAAIAAYDKISQSLKVARDRLVAGAPGGVR